MKYAIAVFVLLSLLGCRGRKSVTHSAQRLELSRFERASTLEHALQLDSLTLTVTHYDTAGRVRTKALLERKTSTQTQRTTNKELSDTISSVNEVNTQTLCPSSSAPWSIAPALIIIVILLLLIILKNK